MRNGYEKWGRIALLIASLGLATLWGIWDGFSPGQEQPRLPRVRKRCQVCHRAETIDWMQSRHARAWVSETFTQATNNRTRTECLHCHAPDRVLVTGFGKEPTLRTELQDHGVDCVGCHEDANEAHHGTLGTKPDEHAVVKNDRFGTVEMCATCHAKFGTVDEFKQTKWAAESPRACVTCHMPEVKRPIAVDKPVRTAHAHTFKGADPETFQKGVRVEATVSGDNLIIKLTSAEVGHNFPTGADLVVAIVDVRLISNGQESLKHQTLLANDAATGGADTRLKPGEVREITIPLQGKKGEAVIRVLHKYLRTLPDEKATVLFEMRKPVD